MTSGFRQHVRDPEDTVALGLQRGDAGGDLRGDLGGVRGAGAEHDLGVRVERASGPQQVGQALLPRDPTDEHDRRAARVDAVTLHHVRCQVGRVLVRVDPVVDHLDAVGVDRRVAAQDVRAHPGRHRDDRVRRLDRRALRPARECVAAAELLGLPGPQRLQAVRAQHVRDAVQQLRRVAGHVRVPGVTVDEVRADAPGRHLEVDPEDTERGVGRGEGCRHAVRAHPGLGPGLAPSSGRGRPRARAARGPGTRRGPPLPRRRPAGTHG